MRFLYLPAGGYWLVVLVHRGLIIVFIAESTTVVATDLGVYLALLPAQLEFFKLVEEVRSSKTHGLDELTIFFVYKMV